MKKTELRFKDPNEKLYLTVQTYLKNRYNSTELGYMQACMKPFFVEYEDEMRKNDLIDSIYKEYGSYACQKSKSHVTAFVALILAEPNNLKFYLKFLGDDVYNIFLKVATCGIASVEELERTYNQKLVLSVRRFNYSNSPLEPLFLWFDFKSLFYAYEYNQFVFLNPFMRALLLGAVLPDNLRLQPSSFLESLPSDEAYDVMDAEADFLFQYQLLKGMYAQGFIKHVMGSKLLLAELKRIAKLMNITEFYPQTKQKEWANLRAWMSISSFLYCFPSKVAKAEVVLKELFLNNRFESARERFSAILLPHIKGMKQSVVLSSNFYGAISAIVASATPILNRGKWVSLDLLYYESLRAGGCISPFSFSALQNMMLRHGGEELPLDRVETLVNRFYYKMVFVLMASLGIVQLAYTQPKGVNGVSDEDMIGAFRFVRLTDLGRYVLGLSQTYEPKESKSSLTFFELDEENLLIRSTEANNPYESLLAEMADFIGNSRYKVSHLSILRSCKSPNDIDSKIDFFKKYIRKDLPPLWADFFESLRKRCNPLRSVSESKYVVFQLDASNVELLRLISSDPILKQHSVKAEKCLLLVERMALSTFTTRLKQFGYLL